MLDIKGTIFIMFSRSTGNINAINKRPALCLQTTEIVESEDCFSPVQKQIRKIHVRSISPLSLEDRSIEPLPAQFLPGISKTFVIRDSSGEINSILKPCALGRKQGIPRRAEENIRIAVPYEEMAVRERIAFLVQLQAQEIGVDLGVPPAEIVSIPKGHNIRDLPKNKEIICSKHQFIPRAQTLYECSKENQQNILQSSSIEIVEQLRKTALLDIQIANTDRTLGNILIQERGKLVPIDHALCLSHDLKDRMNPVWLRSPSTKLPLCEKEKEYIRRISFEKLRDQIIEEMPGVNPKTLATLETTTAFLKTSSELDMTPYEMGCLMHKGSFESSSPLEAFKKIIKEKKTDTPITRALSPYLRICAEALHEEKKHPSYPIAEEVRTATLLNISNATQKLAHPEIRIEHLSEKERILYERFLEVD